MIDRELFVLPLLILFFCLHCVCERHGFPSQSLHLYKPDAKHNKRSVAVFDRSQSDFDAGNSDDLYHSRSKRDAPASNPNGNITTRVNHLNDSHQQLMVHWVGEGSSVIVCLARDPSQPPTGPGSPSALYISYDYGDTFLNKTESFRLGDKPTDGYAQLDKFYNHPHINSFCVFTDIANKMLYQTTDNGMTIRRTNLTFSPNEISYDEEDPYTFVVLDKVDPMRKLYLTRDGGITFKPIEEYVKSFYWSSGPDNPLQFYVERAKPYGTNAVLMAPRPDNYTFEEIIDDVQDFQIKGDFMFATKKAGQNLDLFVSYQRGPFVKAEFQTELDLKEYHISDVTGTRIFISVSHADTLANLYVSEINKDFTEFKFVLSLESILCYFPNSTWNKSWLTSSQNREWPSVVMDRGNVAEESFADLYKVEGLRGIYIASKVVTKPSGVNIGPEHLMSYISFDHGNTWGPIKPPKQDDEGQPINCALVDDCSLHLSQKFSQLYPVTRSATIMSSKSAPGIIMATGVVGKSLKGHPGMFISRDAGLTWKQILKDYYFFNYGDHGGALVAVRYFKTRGETRELLYSTDEGEKWLTHDFHENDLKIYGLMTEPGENTTVFTMFGSAKGHHQWVIIKVDLYNAFSYNCTWDDYKYWSPSSTEVGSKVPCILGVTDTYQRRIPHANCYNGKNLDKPLKQEICQCDRQDFECDFGFVATAHPSHCIRNKTLTKFDPYAVPETCKSGDFYNRTKGYRKIDGDMCTDGFGYNYLPDVIPCPMNETTEFLIFAQRGRIARINLLDNKLDVFPIKGLKNVIAIEFDVRNNCLYWADIVSDVIGRQCLSNGSYVPDIIVKTDIASIEGMSLDWISNVLFFVDGMRSKIEAVRTDLSSEGRMRRTILGPNVLTKPRGIAVHPTAGYLFWTDWASSSPSISRSNLDGTDVQRLFTKPIVEWPNGITIDHIAERIYWVDAMDDYIASSDLNGKLFKKILANDEKVSHPFAVAVFKDTMYWDDWKAKAIFSADKDHGILINTIQDQLADLMDLKVFSHSVQVGTNACAEKGNTCQALCLGMPRGNSSCLCPDGLTMKDGKCTCPGGKMPFSNMTCPKEFNSCSAGQFSCGNGICIPANWQCDGDNDCGDSSDEQGCTTVTCQPQMLLCDTNKCIPHYYRCDHDKDCVDGTDEIGCIYHNCTAEEFKCANDKCIPSKWRCDEEDDCRDGSDELNCKESHPPTCKALEFRCPTNGVCIPKSWTCDGEHDCPDAADEQKSLCKDSKCMDWMFKCPGNGKCLYTSWVCDGEDDCDDGLKSDEQNCSNSTDLTPLPAFNFPTTNQCHNWMYLCNNSRCIPYWWKCDGVNDCGDNSDELGCGNTTFVTPPEEKEKPPNGNGIDLPTTCKKNHYMCANGVCIPAAWVCDGAADCDGGEDELTCEGGPTGHCKEFRCRQDGACITLRAVCDGKVDCADGSDELGCQILKNKTSEKNNNNNAGICDNTEFACDHGKCISMSLRCNHIQDCYDGTDEANCTQLDTEANMCQVNSLNVDSSAINSTTITLYWRVTPTSGVRLQYLPSLAETSGPKANVWRNASSWIEEQVYMFNNLKPYTEYNMTVYVRTVKSAEKDGYPPNQHLVARTGEGVPSPALRLVARQQAGRRVQLEWDAPVQPNGRIRTYQVMVSPPLPPASVSVPPTDTKTLLSLGHFRPGSNYTFWVVAKNAVYQSNSEAVTLMFDAMGDIDELQHLKVARVSPNSFQVSWDQIRGVDGYYLKQKLPMPYPEPEHIKTQDCNVTLSNLSPGVTYTIEVQAFKDELMGRPATVFMTTLGTRLPAVPGVQAALTNNTSVMLTWTRPLDKMPDLQYAVHYGLTMEQMFKVSSLKTSNTSMLIENLQACDSYLFSVGLVQPALGPLSQDPVSLITQYSRTAPVKNLRVNRSPEDPSIMIITWDSSCNTMSEISEYIITVGDLALNKTSTIKLTPTKNASMSHTFKNMQYGGKYNVTVLRNVPGAMSASAIIQGPGLPPPHQVQWRQEPNGSFVLDWVSRPLPTTLSSSKIPQYHFAVTVTEGENNTSVEHVFPAASSPFDIPGLKPGNMYTLRVRMVTNSGYMGPQSEARTLVVPQDMWIKTEQSSMSLLVGIPLGIVAIGACAAFAVLAFKHRRLSSSFARFANPRYDSRSGAATLGNADIMDEDEAPPIRGFSDDEPLVIA